MSRVSSSELHGSHEFVIGYTNHLKSQSPKARERLSPDADNYLKLQHTRHSQFQSSEDRLL